MTAYWPRFLAWLKMTQMRQTVYGALQLLWYAFTHLRVLRIAPVNAVFHRQIFFTGVEALGIVAVFGLLSGALVITQITSLVGGDSELTVKILIWTVVREVGPLFAAIIIIARSSAAIASELALMKTRGEMSSLTRMGIPPQDYLLVPRIFGVTLAVLALTIYFQVVAIGGGLAISAMFQNVAYLDQVGRFLQTVKLAEFAVVAFKGCLFGFAISTISCYNGMRAQPSVTEVPKVAIKAVLQSLLFVFTLDALIAWFGMTE
ncbi:MAG: ABC transporter permease [Gammaproteobacteria bacterium]|nr:ABC transporter permease [Gammaproteobacteria bacterium]MBU1775345.1 ABC transporter permease [Gammaproteobacteria bacterium]MBU1968704.1 ABC transporter permease [Gammaproteobacteria bacterium]